MHYRGFSIEKEGDTYAVRLNQKDRIDDWKPWADTIEEAKAIVDKLIDRAEEETRGN